MPRDSFSAEDQRDASVAEDGGGRVNPQRTQERVKWLDHDVLAAQDLDRVVDLVLWRVSAVGVPRGLDRQQLKWVACDSLDAESLLPADRPFIEALQLLSSAATF